MIFKFKKHNVNLYNTLLNLSRNVYFYKNIGLEDSFETRVYLMFLHFAIILRVHKNKKLIFNQYSYDSLFHNIENNLRELGFGDVSVNKKMKDLNKILYDMLLKLKNNENSDNNVFEINKRLIVKNAHRISFFFVLDNSQHISLKVNFKNDTKNAAFNN